MPDTILEGDHPRIISAKFGWDWQSSFRGEDLFLISSPLFSILDWRPSWLEVGITGHNFGRGPSKDHSTKVWFKLAQWLQRSWRTDGRTTDDGRPVVRHIILSEHFRYLISKLYKRRFKFDNIIPDSETTSLFFLLNATCLAERQQISILLSLVWLDWSHPRRAR